MGSGVELDIHIFACRAVFTWRFLDDKIMGSAKA
jgi:hypothetical protein